MKDALIVYDWIKDDIHMMLIF